MEHNGKTQSEREMKPLHSVEPFPGAGRKGLLQIISKNTRFPIPGSCTVLQAANRSKCAGQTPLQFAAPQAFRDPLLYAGAAVGGESHTLPLTSVTAFSSHQSQRSAPSQPAALWPLSPHAGKSAISEKTPFLLELRE